jgi:hypothetical protein
MTTRGIFVVAFGAQARACAARLMASVTRYMPTVPIALCAESPIGPEAVLIRQPDSDVGGRRAKLQAYDLTPPEWKTVLYLDADTELVAPVEALFQWAEDGWEFVICRDVGETLHSFARKNNVQEFAETQAVVGSLFALQYNGGVWCFRRCPEVARFFARWRSEWERHAQRDQGALIRALWSEPLRVLTLSSEWNTIPKYQTHVQTAGILHYPMEARRWEGKLPGRIDSPEAWQAVERFTQSGRAQAQQ